MIRGMRRLLAPLLLIATLAAAGCSVSPARIHKADAVVTLTIDRQATCDASDASHCATP